MLYLEDICFPFTMNNHKYRVGQQHFFLWGTEELHHSLDLPTQQLPKIIASTLGVCQPKHFSQLDVPHFDTYSNSIKTIWKAKPNSLGIMYFSHTQKYLKSAFLRAPFGLSSEPMITNKGTQYLRLEMS